MNGLKSNQEHERRPNMKYERYPKRPKESNFIAPKEIFWLNITPSEKIVYLYLLSLEDENYQCWPSYKTIGENVNIKSKNTVKRCIDNLCEKGLIDAEYTQIIRNGIKANGNLKYTIRPIYEAYKYDMDKKIEENDLIARRECIEKMLKKYEITADDQVS